MNRKKFWKATLFKIASKKKKDEKYLRICQTKKVKDLYNKN